METMGKQVPLSTWRKYTRKQFDVEVKRTLDAHEELPPEIVLVVDVIEKVWGLEIYTKDWVSRNGPPQQ